MQVTLLEEWIPDYDAKRNLIEWKEAGMEEATTQEQEAKQVALKQKVWR